MVPLETTIADFFEDVHSGELDDDQSERRLSSRRGGGAALAQPLVLHPLSFESCPPFHLSLVLQGIQILCVRPREIKMSDPGNNVDRLRGLRKQGEQMSKFRSIFPRQFFIARDRETSDPVARYQALKQVQQAKGKTYGGRNVQSR